MSDRRPSADDLYEYGKEIYHNTRTDKRDHVLYDKVERFVTECLPAIEETCNEWIEGEEDAEELDSDDSWSDEDEEDEEDDEEEEQDVGSKREREKDTECSETKRSRAPASIFTDAIAELLIKQYCSNYLTQ
jgi:hypothetical protein